MTNLAFLLLEIFSLSSTDKNWKWVQLKWTIPINREHIATFERLCRGKQCGSQLTAICSTKLSSYIIHTGGWYVLRSATLDLFAVLLIRCSGLSHCKFFYFSVHTMLPGELIATVVFKDGVLNCFFSRHSFIHFFFFSHCLLLLELSCEQSNIHLNCYCCSVAKAVSISWSESLKLPYDLSYSYFSCN